MQQNHMHLILDLPKSEMLWARLHAGLVITGWFRVEDLRIQWYYRFIFSIKNKLIFLFSMPDNHLLIDGHHWKKRGQTELSKKNLKIDKKYQANFSVILELEKLLWFQWSYTDFHLLYIHSLVMYKTCYSSTFLSFKAELGSKTKPQTKKSYWTHWMCSSHITFNLFILKNMHAINKFYYKVEFV